jgi:predicted GIY-YIG superfamily endonuclease
MPFQNYIPRVFSTATIQRDAPGGSGVYGISNAKEWIYIGESDNIRASLLEHLQHTGSPVTARNPTGFTYELCHAYNRAGRRDKLTIELKPVCKTVSL